MKVAAASSFRGCFSRRVDVSAAFLVLTLQLLGPGCKDVDISLSESGCSCEPQQLITEAIKYKFQKLPQTSDSKSLMPICVILAILLLLAILVLYCIGLLLYQYYRSDSV